MKALVYHGPGQKAWEDVPKPQLVDGTDAIVRVDAVTICGTDLHILKGDVPAVTDGRILGHEAVGTVEAVGSDVTIEAVGLPATFELAVELARPGGHIASVGVYGKPATLHLEDQWIRDITITTGLVDTYSTPTLLRLLSNHQIDAGRFITHHFALDDFPTAYPVFADAADTGALKVVLTR